MHRFLTSASVKQCSAFEKGSLCGSERRSVRGFASSNPKTGSERMSLRKLVEDPGLRSRAQTRISFFSSDEYNASSLLRGSLFGNRLVKHRVDSRDGVFSPSEVS